MPSPDFGAVYDDVLDEDPTPTTCDAEVSETSINQAKGDRSSPLLLKCRLFAVEFIALHNLI